MKQTVIFNSSSRTLYYNPETGETRFREDGNWSISQLEKASLDNHIQNSFHYIPDPRTYRPVVERFYPIHPKTAWTWSGRCFIPYYPEHTSRNNLRTKSGIRRYCKAFKLDQTALEMSGGLDTALIFGLLEAVGRAPLLIGVVSNRYEFRTESYIQKLIMKNRKSIELDEAGTYPFFAIKNTPQHTIPDKNSLFYGFFEKTKNALPNSVKLLINGVSGDELLAQSIERVHHRWMMNEWWAREHIFGPAGIDYLSAYSLLGVMRNIEYLRKNLGEDSQKLWARQNYAEFLPKELTSYSYKAAHDGILYQGLLEAKDQILEVCRFSQQINRDSRLSEKYVKTLISKWRQYSHEQLIELLAVVSFAVWIYTQTHHKIKP